jgi:hypothetical protein
MDFESDPSLFTPKNLQGAKDSVKFKDFFGTASEPGDSLMLIPVATTEDGLLTKNSLSSLIKLNDLILDSVDPRGNKFEKVGATEIRTTRPTNSTHAHTHTRTHPPTHPP